MSRPLMLILPALPALLALLAAAGPNRAAVAQDAPPPPCSGPEARQFDFWVGERMKADGPVVDRITWTDNGDGTVRQQWDVSRDGGATWTSAFDGLYRPAAVDTAPEGR